MQDLGSEDFEKELEDINKIIKDYPKDSYLYVQRAKAFHEKGDYESAIEDLNYALEGSLDYHEWVEATFTRGNALYELCQFESALQDYLASGTEFEIALCCYGLRKFDLALTYLTKGIEIYEDNSEDERTSMYYNKRGVVYNDLQEYDKAIKDFSSAIELSKNCAEYYSNRGDLYKNTGQTELAMEDFSQALTLMKKESFS